MTAVSRYIAQDSTATIRRIQYPRGSTRKFALVATRAAMFYDEFGRDFSWRRESNPYKLAVAEILLQKTRAPAAQPVYDELIALFPSAAQLSNASEALLERTLRPLGLSRKRSVQLRMMAAEVERNGPTIFTDWRLLLDKVPGIGAYAARAIACFSLGERVGVVDANVARIFRRVFRVPSVDPRAVVYQHLSDAVAIKSNDARASNFGLLDIGATICIAKPRCVACPFVDFCPRYGLARSL